MFKQPKDPGPAHLAELETEVIELKREIETLRREKAELREENDKLKQSLDSSKPPLPAPRGLRPSNSQSGATSATADSGTDSELLKRTIQQLSETRKQLSDVQSRLTINLQVTEATQRRQLIQQGAYENPPTNSVYEKLRFDPSQEPVYAELQPTHIGCSNVLLPRHISITRRVHSFY